MIGKSCRDDHAVEHDPAPLKALSSRAKQEIRAATSSLHQIGKPALSEAEGDLVFATTTCCDIRHRHARTHPHKLTRRATQGPSAPHCPATRNRCCTRDDSFDLRVESFEGTRMHRTVYVYMMQAIPAAPSTSA